MLTTCVARMQSAQILARGGMSAPGVAGGRTVKEAAAPRAVERNSRRLKFFHLPIDFPLDYGVCELAESVSCRRPNTMSRSMRVAPMVMAESAMLKAGHGLKVCQGRKCR